MKQIRDYNYNQNTYNGVIKTDTRGVMSNTSNKRYHTYVQFCVFCIIIATIIIF